MNNGTIVVNENEMDEIKSYLDKTSNDIESSAQKFSSMFSSFTDVGLFSEGATKLKSQLTNISSQVSSMGSFVIRQYDDMEKVERKLSSMAEDIEIPNDFVTNDSSLNIGMKSGKLKKEDGKKVKSTKKNNKQKMKFESCIKYNDNLKEIVKQYENEHGEIVLNGNNVKLSNIKNENDTTIDETMEDSIIIKKIITKLNDELSETIPDIDMSLNIEMVKLALKKVGPLKDVEFNDAYNIVKRELSSMLANGNYNLVR